MLFSQQKSLFLASMVSALMLAGCSNGSSLSDNFNIDSTQPILTLADNLATTSNQMTAKITGKVSDNDIKSVSVSVSNQSVNYPAVVTEGGDFSVDVPLVAGENVLTITAKDKAGNLSTQTFKITQDSIAPTLTLNNDLKNAVSRTSEIVLSGVLMDNVVSGVTLSVSNGQDSQNILPNDKGEFNVVLPLNAGENVLTLTAKDAVGNTTTLQENVYFGNTLTAGGSHTGILDNGKVYAFGRNNFGQIGIGEVSTLKSSNHPATPVLLSTAPVNVVSISFNQNHSSLLTKEGKVYTWGSDANGELGRGEAGRDTCGKNPCRLGIGMVAGLTDVVAIASGYSHKLALTKSGEVWAFGSNSQGQLGQDIGVKNSAIPVKVNFDNANVGKIIQVIASSDASYALDNKGQVWAWGSNEYGNLGNKAVCDEQDSSRTPNCIKNNPKPSLVPLANDVKITELAVGRDHVLALTDKGQVYAWGLNFSSQVGYKGDDKVGATDAWEEVIDTPTLLPWSKDKAVKHVYANGTTSYAMFADNKVYPWGQFGETDANGKTNYAEISEPTDKLPNLTDVKDMGVGALHQLARRHSGEIFSWGWSFEGSLGGKDVSNIWMYNTPILVQLPK